MRYAQINADGVCFAVSDLSGEVNSPDMILAPDDTPSMIGHKYDRVAQTWSKEIFVPARPLDDLKTERVLNLYSRFLSENETTFTFNEKVFGNAPADKENVEDLIWAFTEGLVQTATVPVHTYLGAEVIEMDLNALKGLKAARLLLKNTLWARHEQLSAQIKAAQTVEELELIPEW